jgi:hypothetical protein
MLAVHLSTYQLGVLCRSIRWTFGDDKGTVDPLQGLLVFPWIRTPVGSHFTNGFVLMKRCIRCTTIVAFRTCN